MHTEIGATDRTDARTVDDRWSLWRAQGVERERKANTRAIAAAAVIAGGLGLWLANVLLFG
jgi:hypothetical protein